MPKEEKDSSTQDITHAWFWPRMGQWLQPNDVIITETQVLNLRNTESICRIIQADTRHSGTSNFGILETRFPKGVQAISQVLWGSIGYATASAQGAALAAHEQDPSRRVILFTGDGSLQLTVQEISTMMRHGLKPIIFILNNNGYTIERLIHGETAEYNDIMSWKHTELLNTLGGKEGEFKNHVVKTRDELDKLFDEDKEFSKAGVIQVKSSRRLT